MDKHAAALVLAEIGTLLELRGENRFKARAFYNAARALESLPGELTGLKAGELESLPGLGPATSAVVRELVEAGESSLHRELREQVPSGLYALLALPGLGPRKLHALHETLGIASLDELELALRENQVGRVPGFGGKMRDKLLVALAFHRAAAGRSRRPDAERLADRLIGVLADQPGVERVEPAGELRRGLETVGAVDLLCVVRGGAGPVLDAFIRLPGLSRGERVGETAAQAHVLEGPAVHVRCVPPDAFTAALVHATGSAAHLAALRERAGATGLRLDEYGLWRGEQRLAVADEAALYGELGLAFVPPELREGDGEVEASALGALPRLLELGDLRGCFHCHTRYSDGKPEVHELAEAALARGWRYVGLADHSQAAAYAGGLSTEAIARQHEEVDAWNAERGDALWVFKGIEADILPDGRLDYADAAEDVLDRFDYVVASVHSSFGMDRRSMTERVLRAMEHPAVTFLGHATGRLLLSREGYSLDVDAVIEAAAARGVGIEINANPRRLELDWRHWRRAKDLGVRTAINPDAHSVDELDYVRYGVTVARKGWLGGEDTVNAWGLDRVREYFATARVKGRQGEKGPRGTGRDGSDDG